uniref:Ig-like domain-containing protein n=1 Tax=Kryptolebias marmoratus TaxID=37003 RepID=A0A3Q3EXI1_KRYMA
MPASTSTSEVSGQALWKTVSTLTFTSAAKDHGKQLTCSAQYSEGRTETSIPLRVKRNMLSLDWSFSTPESLPGLKGSCIIIPCKFSYSKSKPDGLQVIWYLYQSKGYPSVYNQKEGNIISKFAGITSLIGSVSEGNCSLKIDKLEMSHNKDRLYPWIDKDSITSFHSQGHSFIDKSTQLEVSENAEEPQIILIVAPKVGVESKVSCTVRHTCITAPPVFTLSGIPGTDRVTDSQVSDGVWERTVERTWTAEEQHKSVECNVAYPGGQKARKELQLNVECLYEEITMINPPGEMIEGTARSVVCSVTYSCKKNKPSIVWNFPDMLSTVKTMEITKDFYNISSNLTFIGSLGDNGKKLKCTAEFSKGETSASADLKIGPYEYKFGEDEPFDTGELQVREADVPHSFSALTRSCVVIPCSFQSKDHELMTRGIWYKRSGHSIVFHNERNSVMDHFKDRTKLLGNLHEGDCSMEIDDIKPFDNGPFCFHAQRESVKYRFNNSCAFIKMKGLDLLR